MQRTTDILVIGSGIAGLFYAIHCALFARVLIVTKSAIGESNTMYAQGGIAAVRDARDSIENHVRDTIAAGDGLCHEDAVTLVATNAAACIAELERMHVTFDRTTDGSYDLHREGGHSHSRVLHTKDATGREVEDSLVRYARSLANIEILEHHFVLDLLSDNSCCVGACVLDTERSSVFRINAQITMLASGGGSQIFSHNTNPPIATGDGYAIARRIGATLQNMEFVQFHPTTLYSTNPNTFLVSEAVRGFGARLTHSNGEEFMQNYHPMASLAPRDVVSRAIVTELAKHKTSCVYLDLSQVDTAEFQRHFPNITKRCLEEGLDLSRDRIPVAPAAHYFCGGVLTDLNAQTTVVGLYACGEVACTGIHGANRLASNSLLEGLVFARQAALEAQRRIHESPGHTVDADEDSCGQRIDGVDRPELSALRSQVQKLMWENVGIRRRLDGLIVAHSLLLKMHDRIHDIMIKHGVNVASMELLNMIELSLSVTLAATRRAKSVGCHWMDEQHSH